MKKPNLLAVSLFTFLVSCFSPAKKEPEPAKPYPRFPESDAAEIKFEHIEFDGDFVMKTFFIAPDKQSIYALAYKYYSNGNPDDPTRLKRTDMRIYALDTKGKIQHHIEMKHVDNSWGSSMGMIGDELLVLTGDEFLVLDTKKFAIAGKIPVWSQEYYPTKHDITLMTIDETRDEYQPLFDAAIKDTANCRWLVWPSGKYYVYVQGPAGKRAAWSPMDYTEEVIGPLKKAFAPIDVSMNPKASTTTARFSFEDGPVKLRETDLLDGGRELDYPNFKYRGIMQYELTLGPKVVHFSTTDQKRQDLRIGYADNQYLTTADGAVWVRYMSWLYRIQ